MRTNPQLSCRKAISYEYVDTPEAPFGFFSLAHPRPSPLLAHFNVARYVIFFLILRHRISLECIYLKCISCGKIYTFHWHPGYAVKL